MAWIDQEATACENGIWYNIAEKAIAWGFIVLIALFTSVMFYRNARASQQRNSYISTFYKSCGYFTLGNALTRMFFLFSDFERLYHCESASYAFFVLVAYFVGLSSGLPLISIIENEIFNSRRKPFSKVFTVFSIITLLFAVFSPLLYRWLSIIRLITIMMFMFGLIVLFTIFMRTIYISSGIIRYSANLMMIGLFFNFIGSFLDSELIIKTLDAPIWFPAIFAFLGYIVLIRLTLIRISPTDWISNILIIEKTSGLCIFEGNFKMQQMNGDLFSGFFSAIQTFSEEITQERINGIMFKNLTLLFRNEPNFFIVVSITNPKKILEANLFLRDVSQEFHAAYDETLKNWKGDISVFEAFIQKTEAMIRQTPLMTKFVLGAQMIIKLENPNEL